MEIWTSVDGAVNESETLMILGAGANESESERAMLVVEGESDCETFGGDTSPRRPCEGIVLFLALETWIDLVQKIALDAF